MDEVDRFFIEERKKELLTQANVISGHITLSNYIFDASKRELFEYDDLDEARKTIGIIKDKFESEGIDDIDKIKSVSEEFATNIESLIEMLANEIELKEYVKTTFNID